MRPTFSGVLLNVTVPLTVPVLLHPETTSTARTATAVRRRGLGVRLKTGMVRILWVGGEKKRAGHNLPIAAEHVAVGGGGGRREAGAADARADDPHAAVAQADAQAAE